MNAALSTSIPPTPIHPVREWFRVPEAVKLVGISRSKLYELIAQGHVRSVSLRENGQSRGTRLVSYPSLQEYLHRLADAQGQPGWDSNDR